MYQKTTILGPFEMCHNPRNTVHLQSLKKKDTLQVPQSYEIWKTKSQTSEILQNTVNCH